MKGTVVRLLELIAPHRGWIALGMTLGSLAVTANVALMGMSAFLISKSAIVTNVADVALAITAVRVLAIGRAAFRYLERYVTHRATFKILADLRVWFYRSIEPLAPARLGGHRSGDLLARIVGDIETLEDFYIRVLVPPVVAVAVIAFASLVLFAFDPLLGIVLGAILVGTAIVVPLGSRYRSRVPAREVVAARAELSARLIDEVQGLADLIALERAAAHRDDVLAVGRELDRGQRDLALIRAASAAAGATLASLAGVAVLGIGIWLVAAGRLAGVDLAVLPLVAIASFEVMPPLAHAVQLQDTSRAAGQRLFELIDAEPEVVDPPAPWPTPVHHGIEIRGLRFRYGLREPVVLDGLDLSVPSGGSVALIGLSGAGKSTLVNLLLRFWDFDVGEILIGGHDLRAYGADQVRAMIGVVSQDVHLFDATIRDNLSVADADLDDERMVAACRMAQIHDAIEALPARYDTRVGEDGVLLSGGERQRLAVARAIIKDAPILILDEVTANLDVATESALLTALAPFMATRTTIVITHRAAVAQRMERTMVLAGGRIVAAP
jgi:thiol reductant ABC exporter CydC subunit